MAAVTGPVRCTLSSADRPRHAAPCHLVGGTTSVTRGVHFRTRYVDASSVRVDGIRSLPIDTRRWTRDRAASVPGRVADPRARRSCCRRHHRPARHRHDPAGAAAARAAGHRPVRRRPAWPAASTRWPAPRSARSPAGSPTGSARPRCCWSPRSPTRSRWSRCCSPAAAARPRCRGSSPPSALAGATYPPLTAAIRGAWTDLTDAGSGPARAARHRAGRRDLALRARLRARPAAGRRRSSLVADAGGRADRRGAWSTLSARRGRPRPVMRRLAAARRARAPPAGSARCGSAGSRRCWSASPALGIAFGAAGVTVPGVRRPQHGGERRAWPACCSASGASAARSAASGSAPAGPAHGAGPAVRLAARRGGDQLRWCFAVMPNPVALGVALVIGGATIAPALTVENTLVGRIAPAAMLNEAYTWVVTVVGRRPAPPAARWPA